jgi:ABC-type multidrug transport system ATPase subunit
LHDAGSGKTTLLKHILQGNHGFKVSVRLGGGVLFKEEAFFMDASWTCVGFLID